jgi:hypothetical protein
MQTSFFDASSRMRERVRFWGLEDPSLSLMLASLPDNIREAALASEKAKWPEKIEMRSA